MIAESREKTSEYDLLTAIRHYLQDKFDRQSLATPDMIDAATKLLIMVARDYDLKRGNIKSVKEYKAIVDKEISDYLDADNSEYIKEKGGNLFVPHG